MGYYIQPNLTVRLKIMLVSIKLHIKKINPKIISSIFLTLDFVIGPIRTSNKSFHSAC